MPTIQELGIDQLPPDQRLQLIGEIWDSLTEAEQTGLDENQRRELDRRIAIADADPSPGAPWHEVRERLRESK